MEQQRIDVGVRGLETKRNPSAVGSSSLKKNDTTSDQERPTDYGEALKRARATAKDASRFPAYLAKNLFITWLLSRVLKRALQLVLSEQSATRVVRFIGAVAFLAKIRAPAKVNALPASDTLSCLPIVGSLFPVLANFTNMHGFLLRTLERADFQTMEVTLPGVHMCLVMDPRDREFVLRSNFPNFTKNLKGEWNSFENTFAELFGRGIFAVDNEEWRDHRKIASHLFSGNALKLKMEAVFNHHGNLLRDTLKQHAERKETIDLQNHLQAVVFDAFCEIAFGVSPGAFALAVKGDKLPFLKSFDFIQTFTMLRFFLPPPLWTLMRFCNLGGPESEMREHSRVLREYILPIVKARKEDPQGQERGDMLSLYIAHAKELNQLYMLDDDYLLDVVANFMVAGRDTTACSLTNFFRYLATNPQAEAILLKELTEDVEMTLERTREMHFASACVNESIRLIPPVCDDLRFCNEDTVLPSGVKVTRGMQLHLPNLAIGRDPHLWHEPNSFLPDRWMSMAAKPGGVRRPDEFMLPVFHGGPRLCLGHAMARFEMITFMCKICPLLKITPVPGQKYELITGPVGFYRDGMFVTVETRA